MLILLTSDASGNIHLVLYWNTVINGADMHCGSAINSLLISSMALFGERSIESPVDTDIESPADTDDNHNAASGTINTIHHL